MTRDFADLFTTPKPIIGMIHLGGDRNVRVQRALRELVLYQEEGVSGAIIEDYHGCQDDVLQTLEQSKRMGLSIVRGVNLLRSPYDSFAYAAYNGARFVQFDSIQTTELDVGRFNLARESYPGIYVLGGVRFKGTCETGRPLDQDLREGIALCEAIVTTGPGTGIETPTEKLRLFRQHLGAFPLIVGAGVTLKNVYEQMRVADCAIIGSAFKLDNKTEQPVDRERVRAIMSVVRKLRAAL